MASTAVELLRRRFGGNKKSILPSGYTQLEYLVGNGAFINAGLRTTNPHKYECELMWFYLNTRQITGANGGNFFGISNTGEWQNGHPSSQSTGVQANAGQWYHVTQYRLDRPTELTVDGILINTYNPTNIENDIYLFNTSTTANTAAKYVAMKYFKVWDGDDLVRHFIPCIDPNNVIGMYDTVNDVFYNSINSNEFGASYGDGNVGIVNDSYINQAGAFQNTEGAFCTTPLSVRSGQVIEISGYVGAVTAGISSLESTGPVMLVKGDGSTTYKTYTYTADKDMLVMFSFTKKGDSPAIITVDGNNITIYGY